MGKTDSIWVQVCRCGDPAPCGRDGIWRCLRCDRFFTDFGVEWSDFIKPMHRAMAQLDGVRKPEIELLVLPPKWFEDVDKLPPKKVKIDE
jgi:hypothetical protein